MTQVRGGKSDRRSLMRRANSRQEGSGADALFASLDALRQGTDARQSTAAGEVLARWADRVRAGMWSDDIAALIAQAEALERRFDAQRK